MKALSLKFLLLGGLFLPIWEIIADGFNTNFGLLLFVAVFTTLDAISGVYAAYRSGDANSKTFFTKFFDKFVAYSVIIILCFSIFVIVKIMPYDVANAEVIITYPMSVILVREFWSIGENINKIQPRLFDKIKNTLNIFKK